MGEYQQFVKRMQARAPRDLNQREKIKWIAALWRKRKGGKMRGKGIAGASMSGGAIAPARMAGGRMRKKGKGARIAAMKQKLMKRRAGRKRGRGIASASMAGGEIANAHMEGGDIPGAEMSGGCIYNPPDGPANQLGAGALSGFLATM